MSDPFNRDPTVVYGTPVPVAPRVRRITCENPSPMTFTGTQSYLVGTGDVALIDPGPAEPAHLRALVDALGAGERITHIVVTHTHVDHSPGASVIAAETGAEVHAFGSHGAGLSPTMQALATSGAKIGGGEGGDRSFDPDRALTEGETLEGTDWSLTAIHTPGHLSNHISLALSTPDSDGVLFTGDTVMGWATTLVSPPEGDMAAFMHTLARLSERRSDRLYLPGHGHPILEPHAMLRHQTAHRETRFRQILDALAEGPNDTAALTRAIYTDVDPALIPAAQRNVLASLIGLVDQGKAVCRGPIAADAVFALE